MIRKFIEEWPAHIATALLIVAVAFIAARQTTLLLYKAALMMSGGCVGYWLRVWFLGAYPDRGSIHDRWQLVALMAAGMLTMGLGA